MKFLRNSSPDDVKYTPTHVFFWVSKRRGGGPPDATFQTYMYNIYIYCFFWGGTNILTDRLVSIVEESELAKQPSEHDVQPRIQPRPETIIDQNF